MSGSYYERSPPTYDAHRKMLDDFYKKYPALAENSENNLTMLIPDVWDTVVKKLDSAPPHTRRECPGAPKRGNNK